MKFRKTAPPAPTFEERLAEVVYTTEGALSIFEQAASELDRAATTADEVVKESELEVMRLREVRDSAFAQKNRASSKANTIRELLA